MGKKTLHFGCRKGCGNSCELEVYRCAYDKVEITIKNRNDFEFKDYSHEGIEIFCRKCHRATACIEYRELQD